MFLLKKSFILFVLIILCSITVTTYAAEPPNETALANELCKIQTLDNMKSGIYAIPVQLLNDYFSTIAQTNPKVKEATINILENDKITLTINTADSGAYRFTLNIKELHYDKDKATLELYIEKKEIVGHSIKSFFFNQMSLGLITSIYGNPLNGNVDSKVNGNTIDIDLKPFATSLFKNGIGQSIGDMLVISKATTGNDVLYLHTNCAINILNS